VSNIMSNIAYNTSDSAHSSAHGSAHGFRPILHIGQHYSAHRSWLFCTVSVVLSVVNLYLFVFIFVRVNNFLKKEEVIMVNNISN